MLGFAHSVEKRGARFGQSVRTNSMAFARSEADRPEARQPSGTVQGVEWTKDLGHKSRKILRSDAPGANPESNDLSTVEMRSN
jgi:hypothetical protein